MRKKNKKTNTKSIKDLDVSKIERIRAFDDESNNLMVDLIDDTIYVKETKKDIDDIIQYLKSKIINVECFFVYYEYHDMNDKSTYMCRSYDDKGKNIDGSDSHRLYYPDGETLLEFEMYVICRPYKSIEEFTKEEINNIICIESLSYMYSMSRNTLVYFKDETICSLKENEYKWRLIKDTLVKNGFTVDVQFYDKDGDETYVSQYHYEIHEEDRYEVYINSWNMELISNPHC